MEDELRARADREGNLEGNITAWVWDQYRTKSRAHFDKEVGEWLEEWAEMQMIR